MANKQKNVVTVLMGAPGAGKTTWVKNNRVNEFLADTHAVRMINDIDVDHYMTVMRHQTIAQIKNGRDVIIDATNTYPNHRRLWLATAQKYEAETRLIAFNTQLALLLAAQQTRKHPAPKKIVMKHYGLMVTALQNVEKEGWDSLTIITR